MDFSVEGADWENGVYPLCVLERETERKIGLPIQNVTCQRKFKFGRIGFPPLPPQNAVTLELFTAGTTKTRVSSTDCFLPLETTWTAEVTQRVLRAI